MADIVDAAQAVVEAGTEEALSRVRRALPRGASARDCSRCGEPIPEARRKAVVTTLCVECAELRERRG